MLYEGCKVEAKSGLPTKFLCKLLHKMKAIRLNWAGEDY